MVVGGLMDAGGVPEDTVFGVLVETPVGGGVAAAVGEERSGEEEQRRRRVRIGRLFREVLGLS